MELFCDHLTPACTLMDLGTGGGEFLRLLPDKAALHIDATEGYASNVELAAKRLQTFGGTLIADYTDDSLPFDNDFFDLVINRHESYDLQEIYRILKPGAILLHNR